MRWYRIEITFAYDGEPHGGDAAERISEAIEDAVCGADHNAVPERPCPRQWWMSGTDVTEEVEAIAAEDPDQP